jgi:uncharacterized protein involved in cysteine biosynthesis
MASSNASSDAIVHTLNLQLASANEESRYSYALKGVAFFLAHPSLWVYSCVPFLCSLIFGLVALILFFALALVPQANALIPHMPEWLAWIIAVILVLLESFLALIIFAQGLFGQFQDKIAEKTLEILNVRLPEEPPFCDTCTLNALHFAFTILLFLVTLPLNVIPIIGSIAFAYINGMMYGWELHQNYFERKRMDFRMQWDHVSANRWAYTTFGAASILLALIPLLNIVTIFTSRVGAALWVVDMEQGKVSFKTKEPQLWRHLSNQIENL